MYENDKKVILTRQDIVAQHKHDQLAVFLKTIVTEVFFIAFCVLITWYTCANWYHLAWLFRAGLILLCALIWFIAVQIGIAAVRNAIRLRCLHKGRYVIEIDRVKLLELRTEEEYKVSRSGRGGHTEIVTNQYVYFEKYEKVKSDRTLKGGQECYLLAVLTKKPYVLKFWECDEHDIKGV